MSGQGNPFVVEGMRLYFSERRILRSCLFAAGALGLVLAAMWPRSTIEASLRGGAASDTFTVVAVFFLLFLVFLSARFGAEDFSPETAARLREYVTLTPVSLFSVIGGRLVFSTLHTVVLLLLGAPFLAAAMAVGGAGFHQALPALATIAAAGIAARMSGLLALALVSRRQQLRDLLLFGVFTAVLVVTWFFAPWANPFHAIAFLLKDPNGSSSCLWCAAADLAAALAAAACAVAALTVVRARAKRREPGHG
jgi:hypothetical protein